MVQQFRTLTVGEVFLPQPQEWNSKIIDSQAVGSNYLDIDYLEECVEEGRRLLHWPDLLCVELRIVFDGPPTFVPFLELRRMDCPRRKQCFLYRRRGAVFRLPAIIPR